ncbi:MAG: hypothetical protein ACK463_21110, partial [Bradyrhizobium sp.]
MTALHHLVAQNLIEIGVCRELPSVAVIRVLFERLPRGLPPRWHQAPVAQHVDATDCHRGGSPHLGGDEIERISDG